MPKQAFSETHQAYFAVDGGITTGLCWGVFPKKGSMTEQVARARKGGELTFRQVNPYTIQRAHSVDPGDFPELFAALQIFDIWDSWNEKLKHKGLYPTKVLIEQFSIRPTGIPTADPHVLSSVRIANQLIGMMAVSEEPGMEWLHIPKMYDPSQTKTFATNPRMKEWGFWEKGMGTDKLEHALDAARLIAVDLANQRSKSIG